MKTGYSVSSELLTVAAAIALGFLTYLSANKRAGGWSNKHTLGLIVALLWGLSGIVALAGTLDNSTQE
jgi:hypothetical protein